MGVGFLPGAKCPWLPTVTPPGSSRRISRSPPGHKSGTCFSPVPKLPLNRPGGAPGRPQSQSPETIQRPWSSCSISAWKPCPLIESGSSDAYGDEHLVGQDDAARFVRSHSLGPHDQLNPVAPLGILLQDRGVDNSPDLHRLPPGSIKITPLSVRTPAPKRPMVYILSDIAKCQGGRDQSGHKGGERSPRLPEASLIDLR